MHPVDLAIVSCYLIYSIFVGLHSKEEAGTNLEEYFLAGRSLKGWQAGLSMAAAQFAADTPLLVTGLIATAGIFSLWRLWVYAVAFLVLGFLLGPSWRKVGVITDAELTEVRYAHTKKWGMNPALVLRIFKAIYLGTIFNCTVLAMVLLAAAKISEPFLTWNVWLPPFVFDPVVSLVHSLGFKMTNNVDPAMIWILSANNLISVMTISAVTAFYSTTGGLRNVVKMDIFQFCIKMVATACYTYFVVQAVGGLGMFPQKLHELFGSGGPNGMSVNQILAFTPGEAKDASLAIIGVFALQWIAQINADGSGYLAQRTMACRSDKDAKQASVIFTVVQIIMRTLLWLPIGVGLLIIFPPDPNMSGELLKTTREATYVTGISTLFPDGVGLKGLMVTAMLTALGSTVDTHVNWGSSYWTNDIYKRFFCQTILKTEPNPRTLVWVARGCNLLILGLALFIMRHLNSIQEAWNMSLLLGAGLGIMLILRWIWWRISCWGEIGAIGATLVTIPILLTYFPEIPTEQKMLWMAFIGAGAGVLCSIISGPEDMDQLKEFYLRAKPPGFWGPVAAAVGDDPSLTLRRFNYSVLATALAATSIFMVLVSLGTWMLGSPAPGWFPMERWVWIAGLFGVGVALVPQWWRLAFGIHLESMAEEVAVHRVEEHVEPDPS